MSTHPATSAARWRSRIVLVLLATIVVPIGVSLLYTYSPNEYTFLPFAFNKLTGLHCPGCGATRACHALLHGEIEQAFAWNPLFVILLPMLFYAMACSVYGTWTGKRAPYRLPQWLIFSLVGTLAVFWVVRNIPVEPLRIWPHMPCRQLIFDEWPSK